MKLYTYFRSSSAFRVRIALNILGLSYEPIFVHLVKGEQSSPEYLKKNPLGIIPALEDGDIILTQSSAIIEYLDETYGENTLYPKNPIDRAKVRSMVNLIACEMQPLNNLSVLNYVKSDLGADEAAVKKWYRHWIKRGFDALETIVSHNHAQARYCFGDQLTAADVFLAPQIWNARRFDCDVSHYPTLINIEKHIFELAPFDAARPENQPDNPERAS